MFKKTLEDTAVHLEIISVLYYLQVLSKKNVEGQFVVQLLRRRSPIKILFMRCFSTWYGGIGSMKNIPIVQNIYRHTPE